MKRIIMVILLGLLICGCGTKNMNIKIVTYQGEDTCLTEDNITVKCWGCIEKEDIRQYCDMGYSLTMKRACWC